MISPVYTSVSSLSAPALLNLNNKTIKLCYKDEKVYSCKYKNQQPFLHKMIKLYNKTTDQNWNTGIILNQIIWNICCIYIQLIWS